MTQKGAFLILISLFMGCARSPVMESSKALRPTNVLTTIQDDLAFEGLNKDLDILIQYHDANPQRALVFGERTHLSCEYSKVLKNLKQVIKDKGDLVGAIRANFDVFEVYGGKKWGEVMATGYYEPVIDGSRKPSKGKFSQALYRTPKDLVSIDLNNYKEKFPHFPFWNEKSLEQKNGMLLRGRLVDGDKVRKVVPYWSRSEIDQDGKLKTEKLEMVYVDPVEAFFMQVQGSGTIRLEDKTELRLTYGAQNGHPYESIGKFLTDKIPLEKMSLQRIEAYLKTLDAVQVQEILNKNPSYVFFEINKGEPKTYSGTPVVPGRTIATDRSLFPKGSIGILEYDKPKFEKPEDVDPSGIEHVQRLVFDQDTGGAIRGGGRVDLFVGRGRDAKQVAGVMKSPGKLFYFAPKKETACVHP